MNSESQTSGNPGSLNVKAHHLTLYHNDGDLVVSAPNGVGGSTFYRIHRFMLSIHSYVFRDMFTLPPAADGSIETYDGVPIVHLPDSAEDMDGLLNVLYDPSRILFNKYDPCAPAKISGVLKLARKYDFTNLRLRTIEHYIQAWPSTLHEWDLLEQTIGVWRPDPDNDDEIEFLDAVFPEPGAAIRLARECDIPQILPSAFYHLSRLLQQDDWNIHHDWNDPDNDTYALSNGRRTARWDLLCLEDYRCLARGREKMDEFMLSLSKRTFRVGVKCNDAVKAKCAANCEQLINQMRQRSRESRDVLAAMLYCESLPGSLEADAELCHRCCFAFTFGLSRKRKELWEKIPEMFNLPSRQSE
ncbi:hypothetical protein BD410DRAFT_739026 [Rickenella mellea]|uniref:BTB domain-containing protein n=1 Tax=Rickenella mellea TaxID=50990 RepID=A0A4Y7QJF2_9AGAM|nr:hypothetical protein BD410DRAFT_739026 [Rickenella mellea]